MAQLELMGAAAPPHRINGRVGAATILCLKSRGRRSGCAWFLVLGAWCLVLGSWFLVLALDPVSGFPLSPSLHIRRRPSTKIGPGTWRMAQAQYLMQLPITYLPPNNNCNSNSGPVSGTWA